MNVFSLRLTALLVDISTRVSVIELMDSCDLKLNVASIFIVLAKVIKYRLT